MKTTILGLGLAGLLLGLPTAAHAQVTIGGGLEINIAFPEPPPLVVVRPGIQVVPEYDEEVYFVDGFYWVRRDVHWYRCNDWRGGRWRPVAPAYVPVHLARVPPGHFRHYYRDDDGRWRSHHPDEWHAWRARHEERERREWWREHRRNKHVRLEQERAWRERERADREAERAQWRRWQDHRREQERADRERRREEYRRRHDDRGPVPARHDDHRGHDGGPRGHDGGPRGHDGGPRDHDGGPRDHDGGPRDHDGGPRGHDGGPREHGRR